MILSWFCLNVHKGKNLLLDYSQQGENFWRPAAGRFRKRRRPVWAGRDSARKRGRAGLALEGRTLPFVPAVCVDGRVSVVRRNRAGRNSGTCGSRRPVVCLLRFAVYSVRRNRADRELSGSLRLFKPHSPQPPRAEGCFCRCRSATASAGSGLTARSIRLLGPCEPRCPVICLLCFAVYSAPWSRRAAASSRRRPATSPGAC